jgi:peptidoglycan/xylan/chitin deacetylase (PgdA/CDA1 family)
MAKECDFGLMVWDAKSTGTLSNVYELLKKDKTSVVFVNKLKKFLNVANFKDFEYLVSIMSDNAFNKADKRIKLKEKIIRNKRKQLSLFPEANESINADRKISAVF